MKLTKYEESLNEQELFFKWLTESRINFTRLSEAYIAHLEESNKQKRTLIGSMAVPLIQYWQGSKIKPEKHNIFIRCKAAYSLLKSGCFAGAGVEKELKALVEKHRYSEDENGIHTINILDK